MNDAERREPDPGPKRLFRSREDRVLGGVSGGLGTYFGVDPIFFRVGFVALTFFGGAGAILYLAAWLFVPREGEGALVDARPRGRAVTVAGAIVLGIAMLSLLAALDGAGWGWWWAGVIGPLALLAILAAIGWALLGDRRAARREPAAPEPAAGEPPAAGGARSFDAAWLTRRIALVIVALAGATVLFFGSALVAAAGGGAGVAALVVVIGAMLVVAAFRGGARWLVVPALLLAVPAGIVSAAEVDLDGGIGEREYRPTTAADVRDRYELGMGRLEVDLRDVELPAGDRPLRVDLGIGEAVVIVPEDVCVALDSRVGAGYARLFDRDSAGLDVDWDTRPAAPPRVPRLLLDADLGMGALQVVHDPGDVHDGGGWDGSIGDSPGNVGCERGPGGERRERRGTP